MSKAHKRIIWILGIFLFFGLEVQGQEAPKRPLGIFYKPLPTISSAFQGYADIPLELQYAFNKNWSAASQIELKAAEDYLSIELYAGPQFALFGQGLDGLVFTLQPGLRYFPYSASGLIMGLNTEISYGLELSPGFLMAVYTGLRLNNDLEFEFGIKLAYLFAVSSDPSEKQAEARHD